MSSTNAESVSEFKAPALPLQCSDETDLKLQFETHKLECATNPVKKAPSKTLENVSLPYKEPSWCGIPPPTFSFEIIKNGTFVSNLPIRSSYIVFGRLAVCDVVFEHPSVSRYHAVVQFCKGDDTHDRGFYLYDLGSTHGTFLNKEPIKSKIYYKLKVGYILKFGGSSRLHIFHGPEEEDIPKKSKVETKTEDEVCAWGMGEDAEDEEEDGEGINPFALSAPNENLYLEDPKKTLRGWFEREGYELEYNCEEKGYKTFSCTIRLPVDTPTGEFLPVEASVSGKKKEAVIACALEACRTLDRLGLLRQSNQESKQLKRKNWEENDYYDSDEDTFYDRSGEIEKRREMRKRLAKKKEIDNFQTLDTKLKTLNEEIDSINTKLSLYLPKTSQSSAAKPEDTLESFMSDLEKTSSAPTDKFEKRKLMLRLTEAEKEKTRLEKLLNIARPAKLPPVSKHPGIIGKRLKSKFNSFLLKPKQKEEPESIKEDNMEVESEEEEEYPSEENKHSGEVVSEQSNNKTDKNESICEKSYGLMLPNKNDVSDNIIPKKSVHSSKVLDKNIRKDEPEVKKLEEEDNVKYAASISACIEKEIASEKEGKKSLPKKQSKEVDIYKTQNNDYCTWTPPSNQSGDGKTHLNAKYGY